MCEYRQALILHSGDWQVSTSPCCPYSFAVLYKISLLESCLQSTLSIHFQCGPSHWEWLLTTCEGGVARSPFPSLGIFNTPDNLL